MTLIGSQGVVLLGGVSFLEEGNVSLGTSSEVSDAQARPVSRIADPDAELPATSLAPCLHVKPPCLLP